MNVNCGVSRTSCDVELLNEEYTRLAPLNDKRAQSA